MAKAISQAQVNQSARIAARTSREAQRLATRLDTRYEKSPVVQSAVTAGRNQVQIGGNLYPAEGISGQGAAVAVVNVGTPAVARYAPANTRSVVSVGGTGRVGGGGGGGGITYLAGDSISIDGSNAIHVVRDAAGAIIQGSGGGLKVNVGNGIQIDSNALTLKLDADPGLEYDAGALRVKANTGIDVGSGGVSVDVTDIIDTVRGIAELSANKIGINLAGSVSGMTFNGSGELLVNAGDGIDVGATTAVDVTDIIDTAYGLTENSNDIRINKATDSGLAFNVGGQLTLGTPLTLTYATSNNVSGVSHSHAITTSSDVGTSPQQVILRSNGSGQLTLAQLTLHGNLVFAGGDRSITASNKLTLAPSGDLLLDPTGLVLLPNAQELRTETFSDLVTGIAGMRLWDRGSNYRQMTIGALKVDELFARVFVADEVRIDRGEEYWSKSYGVVETDFTVPADEATVDVWFENAPELAAANLFSVNDWLLARTIDWGTGLTIQKIWFQVVSLLTAGSVDGYRQRWRIRRKSGGTTGQTVKKGNTFLDAGQVGQGWIHLSALEQDGGPFIQIGEYTSVASDVPQFTNYVRIGNLNGTVDYATDVWGQAAGNNLGNTPSAGFSGYTVDATDGLRLFNTRIAFYDGSTQVYDHSVENGMRFLVDTSSLGHFDRYIRWVTDIDPGSAEDPVSFGAYNDGTNIRSIWQVTRNVSSSLGLPFLSIVVVDHQISGILSVNVSSTDIEFFDSLTPFGKFLKTGQFGMGRGISSPASIIHAYETTSNTDASAGVTIEQNGTGDAVLQFLLTNARRITLGIDNSDGDKFKINNGVNLGSSALLTIDPATGYTGFGTENPSVPLHVVAQAVSSTRERFMRFEVSDATNAALFFFNQTSANGGLLPAVGGIADSAGRQSLDVAGYITSAMDSGTVALVRFNANVTSDVADPPNGTLSAVTVRPLFSWANSGSVLMQMLANGYLGIGTSGAVSPLHVYENTSSVGINTGLTIEQAGSGDAVLQFILPATQRWVMGIDNSADGNPLVIAPSADLATGIWQLENNGKVSMTGDIDADEGLLKVQLTGSGHGGIDILNFSSDTADVWLRMRVGTIPPKFWTIGIDRSQADALVFTATNTLTGSTSMILSRTGELSIGNGIFSAIYGGTSAYQFIGRAANGSAGSPTQVTSGTNIMALGGLGYTSSGWASSTSAEILFQAAQSFTSSARGTKIDMYVTKIGQTIKQIALELGDDRQVFVPGTYAHTTAGGANVNVDSDGWLRRSTSSSRYKQDIRPLPGYGSLFDRLEPIVYKPGRGVGGGNRDYPGLIAEDVLAAGGRDFVTFGDDGEVEYVMYDRLVVLTIAEVQAMKREIADLKGRVAAL